MQHNVETGDFKIFNASEYRVGIVLAQFNRDVCDAMMDSALETLAQYGVNQENITMKKVAGAVEVPVVLAKMAASGQYDALVAIGVIIRGSTPHFEYVANMVTDGVLRVQLDYIIPVGFGVLTTENKEQAEERIHVGGQATEAALHTAKVLKEV